MSTKQTWRNLEDDDRKKLASTLFTRVWQAVGRGIRGNVPVIVVFVDFEVGTRAREGQI